MVVLPKAEAEGLSLQLPTRTQDVAQVGVALLGGRMSTDMPILVHTWRHLGQQVLLGHMLCATVAHGAHVHSTHGTRRFLTSPTLADRAVEVLTITLHVVFLPASPYLGKRMQVGYLPRRRSDHQVR